MEPTTSRLPLLFLALTFPAFLTGCPIFFSDNGPYECGGQYCACDSDWDCNPNYECDRGICDVPEYDNPWSWPDAGPTVADAGPGQTDDGGITDGGADDGGITDGGTGGGENSSCTVSKDCADGRLCVDNTCRTPCPTGKDTECQSYDFQLTTCGSDKICYSDAGDAP